MNIRFFLGVLPLSVASCSSSSNPGPCQGTLEQVGQMCPTTFDGTETIRTAQGGAGGW